MQVHIFLLLLLILILHEGKLNLSSTSLFCWVFFSYTNKILVNFRVLVNTHTEHLLSAQCVTKIYNQLFFSYPSLVQIANIRSLSRTKRNDEKVRQRRHSNKCIKSNYIFQYLLDSVPCGDRQNIMQFHLRYTL